MKHKMFVLLSLLSFSLTAMSQGGMLVRPSYLEYNLQKNQEGTSKIIIRNNQTETLQFKLYVNDWLRDTLGNHSYQPVNSLPFSCSQWVKLDQEFVELAPGETKEVLVKLTMPDADSVVKQMRWSMVFVETVKETKTPVTDGKGLTSYVNTKLRVGVHIYQTPPSIQNKELQMISFSDHAANDKLYRVICQNTGGVQLNCRSNLEILNLDNGQKMKLPPNEFPMFPSQTRYVDFVLPAKLDKGKYTLIATVDAGEDMPLEAAQKTIEIK